MSYGYLSKRKNRITKEKPLSSIFVLMGIGVPEISIFRPEIERL